MFVLTAVLSLVAAGLGVAGVAGWVVNVAESAPNINQLKPRDPGQLSEVYGSDGSLLGYISSDTRGHARALPTRLECPICRTNVLAHDPACTPLPPPNFHGKEGVDGSSPSEGFAEEPARISKISLPKRTSGAADGSSPSGASATRADELRTSWRQPRPAGKVPLGDPTGRRPGRSREFANAHLD